MPDWASDKEKRLAKIQEAMAALEADAKLFHTSICRGLCAAKIRQAGRPHHDPGFSDPLFWRAQTVDQRALRRVFQE
jgi:hypothetical protein